LVRLDDDLTSWLTREILPPPMPEPLFPLVIGFEDMRIFEWHEQLWFNATVREMTKEGWCEQVLGRLVEGANDVSVAEWSRILPDVRAHEKNWMPQSVHKRIRFHYRPGKIIYPDGKNMATNKPALAVEHMSGGTQVIRFENSWWLALVHEARLLPGKQKRYYQHRFMLFDSAGIVKQVSLPFVFHEKQFEFAAGLTPHPDGKRLVISYGVRDCEAWLGTIDIEDVKALVA
jgi:hypothetical protein